MTGENGASEGPRPEIDSWAEVYDLADADRSPYFDFYTGLVNAGTRSVLELGCGTGTILREVPARARGNGRIRGAGLDLSERMLAIARRHDPEVEWIYGDMRAPPLAGPFDLVFSCYNSLQSLPTEADLAKTFSAVRALLAPQGRFAFDIYQPNIPYIRAPVRDRLARLIAAPDGRRLEVREDTRFDPASQVLVIDWRLVEQGAPIAATRYRLRQFSPEELAAALDAAGLVTTERYGGLDRSRFTRESKKQVLVCRANRDG